MAKLSNQAQEFWYKLIDSDTIKNGITLLTELLGLATDFVDTFGALGVAGVGIGAYLGIKNAGKTYECMFSNHYCFEYAYLA